jgi:hypothetical protein
MSRILRRPMFRGGRVSSYGTGIASGLANGGMPPKRGLVDGPGGYSGEGWYQGAYPNWQNIYGSQGIKGADVVASAQDKWMKDGKKIYGPFSPYGEGATIEELVGDGRTVGRNLDEDSTMLQFLYSGDEDPTLESADVFMKEWVNEDAIKRQKYEDAKTEFEAKPENKDKEFPDQSSWEAIEKENKSLEGKKDIKSEQANIAGQIDTSLTDQKVLNNQNTTDDAELSLEEIKEALGAKKAFGRDATEMLLGFAGAQGDTVMEKFQDFAATEAKKGPSRTEKIDEAAATIMLKDKLGARSDKRKIDLMKAEVNYKINQGKKISLAEGVLAATKGTSFSDKKLAAAIQNATSDNTGEKYKFKGVTDSAGLKANITNGNLKVGDTVIVKETIKVKGQPDKVIKKIVEVVMKDGKLDVQEVYNVS